MNNLYGLVQLDATPVQSRILKIFKKINLKQNILFDDCAQRQINQNKIENSKWWRKIFRKFLNTDFEHYRKSCERKTTVTSTLANLQIILNMCEESINIGNGKVYLSGNQVSLLKIDLDSVIVKYVFNPLQFDFL